MHRSRFALIAGVIVGAASVVSAQDARPAEAIIQEIEAVAPPAYDPSRREEEGYLQSFFAARNDAMREKAALILELYETHPEHDAIGTLLPERWMQLMRLREHETLAEETAAYLKTHQAGALAAEAAFYHAYAVGVMHNFDEEHFMPAFETFARLADDKERAARLLMQAAGSAEGDRALALYRRAVEQYPDARSTKYAHGKIRQVESIGKPFELSFSNAIGGETVSMKDLAGKVVVIDFWATWCGPCVAEMPHMKELYAKYKDEGVEFIGVSLDAPEEQQGLESLRAFVRDNDIQWPQFYQGAGWESDFSTSWGINSIPTMFVVDQQGNLYSTSARGKLEVIIPKLLGKEEG